MYHIFQGTTPGSSDGKSSEGKEKSPLKRSKGSLGSLNMITGKNNNDPGKTSGVSANGVFSQRFVNLMHLINTVLKFYYILSHEH